MKKTLKFAFQKSLPVLFGYLFLGSAFGIMLQQEGYNFVWALFCSIFIYAGSGQFLLVSLLSGGATLYVTALMTLLINSRHIFYGLSFLDKFKKMRQMYPYMIFSLTDETYSVLCSCSAIGGIDENKALFFIALFDHLYWIAGSVLGSLMGQYLPFDFAGIEFSMTALFVVIFVEQWKSFKSHIPAVVGLVSATVFLLLLGANNFILPSLIVTVTVLMLCKNKVMEKVGGET
ncbi:MAG: AzlC family ABC transporter permease [Oscillospiraceae bacterium]|nr:AzlC family ABC transporter permease [Oscillospiraceae bacterium]